MAKCTERTTQYDYNDLVDLPWQYPGEPDAFCVECDYEGADVGEHEAVSRLGG